MKILFVCQYFYPETFRGNDIAFHLAAQGHKVHVVTGVPNYPQGQFYNGYGIFRRRHETVKGVEVSRLPLVPRGDGGKIMLALNYLSYLAVSLCWMLFHAIGHKYDRVLCQQSSPVTLSASAVLYKKLRRVPLYTWVLDVWPECLEVAGHVKNKYIIGFFDWFVKKEYKHSCRLLTSSKSFERSILKYGDYHDKIIYYPQWSDGNAAKAAKFTLPEIPKGFRVMFAGAVGESCGMEFNLQAALMTREHKDIKWIIVGDGRRIDRVKKFVKDNQLEDTVILMGRYPSDVMPQFFAHADVMLASLRDSPLFNLYCPAKISSYMAAEKPIIAMMNGEGGDVVKAADCGWTVAAGDSEGLAKLVISLAESDRSELAAKGMNGKEYYYKYFSKAHRLALLDEIMDLTCPATPSLSNSQAI